MHEALRAALAAEELGGAIGQHLVHVHVALRAGARLPDHERKFSVMAAGQHLVGAAPDRLGLARVEQPESAVRARGRFLHQRKRVDDGERHALARDAEKAPAALGLRAPEPLGLDLDRAEAIFLDARAGHAGAMLRQRPAVISAAPAPTPPSAPSPCRALAPG